MSLSEGEVQAILDQVNKIGFTTVGGVTYAKVDIQLLKGLATLTSNSRFPGLT